jgi:polyisoprenoid-binding protein YceI
MHGWKRWALAIGITVVALGVGGPFVYFNFIQDDPPPPLSIDSSTTVAPGASTTPTTLLPSLDGTWKVASGSTAGYRVKETLLGQSATAVGRTDAVTGDLTLTGTEVGAASFSVDMTQVTSSESRRDGAFQGRIMDTAQFPTATFELTTPIELGTIPAREVEIKPRATGTLTLHGTARTVTVALTAKRSGNSIRILGSIPITFADYNIDNPSGGPASVGDSGTLEFLLVLSKSS